MEKAIVLDDELLKEFYEFKHNGSYDNETIQNLLHYYKPHITNVAQLQRVGINNASLFAQLAQSNLTHQTPRGLCDKTTYKIILHKDKTYYPYVKISEDILENNYTSTFYKNVPRAKAQNHIKALLKDASRIFLYDTSIKKQWDTSKKFFLELVPRKNLNIFYVQFPEYKSHLNHLDKNHVKELKNICVDWSISKDMSNTEYENLHDRYLIIDSTIEVILTSGFDYLFDENKDFTYIVRKK
ncbi:MAG: Unknown protein [uncultured Sulfurovum sp.]|uniref:Uncharacterized protein n=1 Tax=uncultured Sulfurovum sp. TaxID=269237 RepID=A0A6S6T6G0_9BACT|nr:MAG: Unknown protein [uncultured Sulfurovum sp.]